MFTSGGGVEQAGAGGGGLWGDVWEVVRLTPDLRSDGGREGVERWTRRVVGGGGGLTCRRWQPL